jgi:oligoribonuclease NrnB/cAMP/cGMP phosphodiesterase (DHH superfamily)
MDKPLCIYHGNCADGFGAAWVVRRFFKGDVELVPGVYGFPNPEHIEGRDIIMVDFSYKRPVLDKMAQRARSILILDHHKTAQEDLAGFAQPESCWLNHKVAVDLWEAQGHIEGKLPFVRALFDMNRSGAGLTWDYFFAGEKRPRLIDHIEDRDLWRFALPGTREINGCIFSHPYDFETWDSLVNEAEEEDLFASMKAEGRAIDRKMLKDIAELLGVATRRMKIGGVEVPVVNLPYTMASEAAGKLAEGAPFAAAYFDREDARVFSLRSRGDNGADVSAIAKMYGGGGHKNAAGFQMPVGWEGDA